MANTDKSLTAAERAAVDLLEVLKYNTGLDWVHKPNYNNPFCLHQTALSNRAYKFHWGPTGATFQLVEANGASISGCQPFAGLTIETAWKAFKGDMLRKLALWNDSSAAKQLAHKKMEDDLGGVSKWEWSRYKLDGMISSEEIYSVSVDDKVSISQQGGKLILVSNDFDKHYADLVNKAAKWDEHNSKPDHGISKIDTLLETLFPVEEQRKVIKAKIDLMQHFGYADKNWLYKEVLSGK